MEIHYHIRWSTGTLDWRRFETRRDAEMTANELVQPGETFAIDEYAGQGCPKCLNLVRSRWFWF